ncbi:tRNA (N6-threonylcarbamoyladenosine(37)-N6)-methyltransferase TrmO [Desulfococcaceae bacterium HSG9]|nr:tRNA (N6-threonylcarbamoyladenosine(37)-N6)-methyltransferase TrmO [Desulfococcaceae bacterium HSG9]
MTSDCFQVYPIGFIKKQDSQTIITIRTAYKDALLGLDQFSHIIVCYWFHQNDTPEKRNTVQVYPRRDKSNPLSGVFATRAPLRPNLIACSTCKLLAIDKLKITVNEIDAFDKTPVIDIKPFIPSRRSLVDVKVPEWVQSKASRKK